MAASKKKTAKKAPSRSTKPSGGNKKAKKNTAQSNPIPVYIITMGLLALFLGIFMYVDTGGEGIINEAVRIFFCGMFGRAGFFIPIICFGMMMYMSRYKDIRKFWIKLLLLMLTLINISALAGLYNDSILGTAFAMGAYNLAGGGLLGTAVSVFLTSMIQTAASYIVLIITLIVLAGAVSGVPLFKLMGHSAQRAADKAADKYGELKEKYEEERVLRDREREEREHMPLDVAQDFADEKKRGFLKFKKPEDGELPQPKRRSEDEDFSDGIDEVFGAKEEPDSFGFTKEDAVKPKYGEPAEIKPETESKADTPAAEKAKKREKSISEDERQSFHEEFDSALEKPVREYVYPTVDLLNVPKKISGDLREELRRTAEKLIRVLDDFGVKAKLLQVTQGPTVTRFEIQPDTGIKLSKIVGLADDIALNLAVSTVLVAPVQGKAAVGVEIPNNSVSTVSIREMIESDKFRRAKSKLTVALGKDIGGNVVVGDIAKMPHVLIAGATGSGKSVCINTIITSILYKASPEEVKLIMVDPKVVELGVYNGIPHLLVPVVTEPKKAAGALNWAVTEMMRRYELFKDTGVRKLESYNELMESRGEDKIPQLVIIIDELADLMMVAAKEVEDYVCRLAQLARAAGIHLIIATQRPSVDVITGLIKANIPSRIAFAVSSQVDSRTILDKGGAEKLLGMGDMLYYPMGARETIRVQGAFVSDAEIERIIDFIKDNTEPNTYSEDLAEHIERCSTGENGVTPDTEDDGDALLPDAVALAVELGKISTSMIQRRLGVGYSRAGRIVDQMEARGIISPANGSKPRDVLISHADMAAVNSND
ncbi:MAG: DNA translocase FtsK [Clostridia bacterium]|nr:DNA translocase FtsK [Clostridia bacterium]